MSDLGVRRSILLIPVNDWLDSVQGALRLVREDNPESPGDIVPIRKAPETCPLFQGLD